MATGFPDSAKQRLLKFWLVSLLGFVAISDHLGEDAAARKVGFLLEGSFEDHEIARMAEGATKTVVVPFYEWDYGIRAFSEAEWKKRGLTWEKVDEWTRASTKEIIEEVKADVIRDERGIVEYVILADKNPFLTGLILSPVIHETYRDLLGDRIHAIPIDRNRIYLFPATGGSLKEYGPALADEFRRAPLPVTLEIFLLDDSGYRVVGELRRGG